jgi:glycosyltransferase involved in cell wall biosynthesis
MSPTIAGVIVMIPAHAKFITQVLEDIRRQTVQLDELIIVASGQFDPSLFNTIKTELESLRVVTKLDHSRQKRPAGFNRNLGISLAQSDYIMFFDADDRYSQERVAKVKARAESSPFSLLLHHALVTDGGTPFSKLITVDDSRREQVWLSKEIFSSTFPSGARDRLKEIGGGVTALVCPQQCQKKE